MTPTLLGRWQTRIFLLSTIGLLVTWAFASGWFGVHASPTYFWVLFYVGLLGLGWDILYNFLQQFMWDHDWPGVFQLFAAVAEAVVLALLIKLAVLPQIKLSDFNLAAFGLHYGAVWVSTYLCSWVVMRLLFPRWRFRGGQWLGQWSKIH